jgi:hypothetical protein
MVSTSSVSKLSRFLEWNRLSKPNTERAARIFYDAAKVIYEKQERLSKPQLKMKEIASALVLVDFHHSSAFRFDVTGDLASNFGPCDEGRALVYYEKFVMGNTQDSFGRKVVIDEDGMRFLYKDHETGKHTVASENYEDFRGKRLPWVKHVLCKSSAVYVSEERVDGRFRRTYLYTGIASIPLEPKPKISYFLVIVKEDPNKNLRFVTAYDVFKYNRFLQLLEPTFPFKSGERSPGEDVIK